MNYKFELTEQEANYVLGLLSEQPYKVSAPLIAKLQSQAQVQQKIEKKGEKN